MSLMARLGGRSSRKVPFALFDGKDSVDLSKTGVYRADVLYTPEASHEHIGGYSYIRHGELVICNLAIKRNPSTALTVNGWETVGMLDPAFGPEFDIGFNFVGPASVTKDDGSAVVAGYGGVDTEDVDEHMLVVRTFTALSAAAQNVFRFHSLSYPLKDVAAATALLKTGTLADLA